MQNDNPSTKRVDMQNDSAEEIDTLPQISIKQYKPSMSAKSIKNLDYASYNKFLNAEPAKTGKFSGIAASAPSGPVSEQELSSAPASPLEPAQPVLTDIPPVSAEAEDITDAEDIAQPPEQEPENDSTPVILPEKEEPIPSLFEGIGRTDWSIRTEDEDSPYAYSAIHNMPYEYDSDHSPLSDSDILIPEELHEPNEDEDNEVDVFELLDFIDDIEFSDLEPEPLQPVKYLSSSGASNDPYNTVFNNSFSDDTPDEEPAEFSITPGIIFEKS